MRGRYTKLMKLKNTPQMHSKGQRVTFILKVESRPLCSLNV